jgi:TPR repeat protein
MSSENSELINSWISKGNSAYHNENYEQMVEFYEMAVNAKLNTLTLNFIGCPNYIHIYNSKGIRLGINWDSIQDVCVNYTGDIHSVSKEIIERLGDYYYFNKWVNIKQSEDSNLMHDKLLIYNLIGCYKSITKCIEHIGEYFENKRPDLFLKYLQKSVELDSPRALCILANYYRYRDVSIAISYYERAVEMNHDPAMSNLAMLYEGLKDYPNMVKYLEIADTQGDVVSSSRLGDYYKKNKDFEKMLYYYVRSLSKCRFNAFQIGVYYESIGNTLEASRYFDMFLDGTDSDYLIALAEISQKLGCNYKKDRDEHFLHMKILLQMAINKNSELVSDVHNWLGYHYQENEPNPELMIKHYQTAIEHGNTSAMNNLGLYYESIGDEANAFKCYKMCSNSKNLM